MEIAAKLDIATLSAEEQAIWDSFAMEHVRHGGEPYYAYGEDVKERSLALIQARRTMFAPAREPAAPPAPKRTKLAKVPIESLKWVSMWIRTQLVKVEKDGRWVVQMCECGKEIDAWIAELDAAEGGEGL